MNFRHATHYRFLLVRKLVRLNIFDLANMAVWIGGNCYGRNPFTSPQDSGTLEDLKAKLNEIENLSNQPDSTIFDQTSVELYIYGHRILLSSRGLRGRVPNDVITSVNGAASNSMRTLRFDAPDTYTIQNSLNRHRDRITNWNRDQETMVFAISRIGSNLVSLDTVRNSLNTPPPVGHYYWTNSESLTHRSLSEIISDIRTGFNAYSSAVNLYAETVRLQTQITEIDNFYRGRLDAIRIEENRRRELARQEERRRQEAERLAREEEERRRAASMIERIETFSNAFANFKPKIVQTSQESKKNLEQFLAETSQVLNGATIQESDENGLLPSVSIDYNGGIAAEITASNSGLFVTRLDIPTDKVAKFVALMKSL